VNVFYLNIKIAINEFVSSFGPACAARLEKRPRLVLARTFSLVFARRRCFGSALFGLGIMTATICASFALEAPLDELLHVHLDGVISWIVTGRRQLLRYCLLSRRLLRCFRPDSTPRARGPFLSGRSHHGA
jgi:hypothetical protein